MPAVTYSGPLPAGSVELPSGAMVPFVRGVPVTFSADDAAALDADWSPAGAADADTVPDTVADVKRWVDGDPTRARAALDAEQARPAPRQSLIDHLTPLTTDPAAAVTQEP